MVMPENHDSENISDIEGKISYFANNSGRILLMNPMKN